VDNTFNGKITEKSITFLNRVLVRDVEARMGPDELFSYSFTTPSPLIIKPEH
jgi:hypothetical protein